MTTEPELLQHRDGGVLVLTMNRPEVLNALGLTMMTDLLQALTAAQNDPEIGCIVLTGSGRAFSSGGDMKARAAGQRPMRSFEEGVDELRGRIEDAYVGFGVARTPAPPGRGRGGLGRRPRRTGGLDRRDNRRFHGRRIWLSTTAERSNAPFSRRRRGPVRNVA